MKQITEEDELKKAEYRIASHIKNSIWEGLRHAEEKSKKLDELKSETISRLKIELGNMEHQLMELKKSDKLTSSIVFYEGGTESFRLAIKIIEECELNGLKWI